MKFIFPQNYTLSSKLLGIIEYSTAIFDLIWSVLILILINIIFDNLSIKIFFFIALVFPVIIFSIVGINGENIIYFFSYMIKYIFKQKVLLYEKE